jgi:hypothetical protein
MAVGALMLPRIDHSVMPDGFQQIDRGTHIVVMNFINPMDDSSYRLIFYLDRKDEIQHYSSKEHPKISKIAKFAWLRNVVKYEKYGPLKLANFEYFSITRGKCTTFS